MFLFAKTTNIVENVIETHSINSKIDYKVYLFENDYINSEYMPEGKAYISNLVSKIKADFDYAIKTSDKFDSEYEYDIYAVATVAHESSGKELWTKRIDLVNNVKSSIVYDSPCLSLKLIKLLLIVNIVFPPFILYSIFYNFFT